MDKTVIYDLKQQFGKPGTIYKIKITGMDLETGRKTFTRQVFKIRKLVILPDNYGVFAHNLSAGKSGTYYGADTKVFLTDFKIELDPDDDYITVMGKHHQIKKIEDLGGAQILFTIRVPGLPVRAVYDMIIFQKVEIYQDIPEWKIL